MTTKEERTKLLEYSEKIPALPYVHSVYKPFGGLNRHFIEVSAENGLICQMQDRGSNTETAAYMMLAANLAPDLAREVERLEAENDAMKEVLNGNARATVGSLGFAGKYELLLKHPVVALFLLGFAEFWVESGAKNYLEMTMSDERAGDFTITIQRIEGKTPHQLKKEALEEVERLKASMNKIYSMVTRQLAEPPDEYDTGTMIEVATEIESALGMVEDEVKS